MKKKCLLFLFSAFAATLFSGFSMVEPNDQTEACKWFIPNIFSPNDDGVNDTFLPYSDCGANLLSYEMKIFNRWGRLVFETTSLDEGWNGKAGGKDLPSEIYVYYIRYTTSDDIEKETELMSGDVFIIR